jgi:hypothetical protein
MRESRTLVSKSRIGTQKKWGPALRLTPCKLNELDVRAYGKFLLARPFVQVNLGSMDSGERSVEKLALAVQTAPALVALLSGDPS